MNDSGQNILWIKKVGGNIMADRVWKVDHLQVNGHFDQLLLNKFFESSTPSRRNTDDGAEKMGGGMEERK